LNCIDHTNSRVLCIFDELFSGTNPKEASASAYAFLKYISSKTNCTFLLTTHFLDVCQKLTKTKSISIHHMKTLNEQNKLTYTYKLSEGISDVRGGINVLIDMNYPNDIINSAKLCG
jgi:DNA mismatch repair ATPase MutS